MRPILYRFPDWIPVLGDQPITAFGLLLLVAVLLAGVVFVRRLRGVRPEAGGWDLVVLAIVGGLVGAKLVHLAVHGALGLPVVGLGRAGMNGLGGLAGGAAALFWGAHRQRLPAAAVAAAAAGPLLLGYAVARLGSFLAGADYGVPTALPWGMTFPAGTPPTTPANLLAWFGLETPPGARLGDFARVHPTQLYEAGLALAGFLGLEAARRRGGGGWRLFGAALIVYGSARLPVELLRAKQDQLVGPLTVDFLLALAVAGVGAALMVRGRLSVPVTS